MKTELYNLQGIARKLNLPPKWIKEQVEAGNIPCLRVTKRRTLFNLSAVKKALANMAAEKGGGHAS